MNCLFLAMILSQPPAVPNFPPAVPTFPPAVPLVESSTKIKVQPRSEITYISAYSKALESGKPMLVYVGASARDYPGSVVVSVDHLKGYPDKCLVLSVPKDDSMIWKATLSPDAGYEQIGRALKEEVSREAIPFGRVVASPLDRYIGRPLGRPTAEGSPWLSVREQKKMRSMWPAGVEFPPTLKFYSLRPASQAVAAFDVPGAGNNHRFVVPSSGNENPNRDFPWIGSGGMDFAKAGTWRNVTGMALPESKKIEVWREPMIVGTQSEWAVHWQFPTGTQMFDVLIRRGNDGEEHIFNVRRRIKLSTSGWDNGASFLPDVPVSQVETYYTEGNRRTKDVLGVRRIAYRLFEVDRVDRRTQFKEVGDPSIAMNDGGHFFPPGFKGAGMSCNKCHNGAVHEARLYGGPLLRGKDTVFSWYPVDPAMVVEGDSLSPDVFAAVHVPSIDFRWPLVYLK